MFCEQSFRVSLSNESSHYRREETVLFLRGVGRRGEETRPEPGVEREEGGPGSRAENTQEQRLKG